MRILRSFLAMFFLLATDWSWAAETVTYTYDAKGRVVKVVRSGSVNNGKQIEYTHDRADNRKRVKVTGAP